MEKFKWNQTRAAQYLGVTRKTLRGRLAKYGIKKPTASWAAPGIGRVSRIGGSFLAILAYLKRRVVAMAP